MYQEYSKGNFKIILTLIDGNLPCVNIYFSVFNYNYVGYGPALINPTESSEWLNKYIKIFESNDYLIEYSSTHLNLIHGLGLDRESQIINRVEYPMNYILRSMERLDRLEQVVAKLAN